MSKIAPFPGIRYNEANQRDVSSKLAPPYDVLDDADKQRLLAHDPANFVLIDLPHTPPKAAGPAEVYQESRDTLDRWLAEGVMVRDQHPAIYVYHQSFTYEGTAYTRKKFFARLRIEPFGEGSVFPHEKTFGGPKEDRLALTKAHEANLSPIFGLYEDQQNIVAQKLEAAATGEPLLHGTLDSVGSKLWAVTDPDVISEVALLMADKPVFIADGHHRYGTAGLYKDWYTKKNGALPEDHPANFVLCVFCAMEDPGLLILPTHRVLAGVDVQRSFLESDDQLKVDTLDVKDPHDVPQALGKYGPQAICCYSASEKTFLVVRPREENILEQLEPDHSARWRQLGLAFLHAYVLDRRVTPELCNSTAPEIRYIKADQAAVDAAHETSGTAFMMQSTTMEEMRAVCQADDLMPQKSTYFYPKLASGMVVNPLK